MGVVYRARDRKLGRLVALKFLSPHLVASERAKQRFLTEARAASALDHPAIATVHAIEETPAGDLYIVMAYYEGETVAARVQRHGAVRVGQALDLAIQAGEGLARAHDQGIVHRDVKPANLMITGEGRVKVLDFGLAKVEDVSLTDAGTTLGTPAYMSPEQARGGRDRLPQRHLVARRRDVRAAHRTAAVRGGHPRARRRRDPARAAGAAQRSGPGAAGARGGGAARSVSRPGRSAAEHGRARRGAEGGARRPPRRVERRHARPARLRDDARRAPRARPGRRGPRRAARRRRRPASGGSSRSWPATSPTCSRCPRASTPRSCRAFSRAATTSGRRPCARSTATWPRPRRAGSSARSATRWPTRTTRSARCGPRWRSRRRCGPPTRRAVRRTRRSCRGRGSTPAWWWSATRGRPAAGSSATCPRSPAASSTRRRRARSS